MEAVVPVNIRIPRSVTIGQIKELFGKVEFTVKENIVYASCRTVEEINKVRELIKS